MKCSYKYCFCQDKDVVKESKYRVGPGYYHEDCLKTRNDINEMVNLFLEKVNKDAVVMQLRNVINNIIFSKGFTTEYLMFGIKYYIENKKLNYPAGLYYVIQDKDVAKAFNDWKAQKIKEEMKNVEYESDSNETTFNYKPTKTKGFGDIFGG